MASRVIYDRSDWTVQHLADFLEQRQECNEERVRSRYEADQVAQQATMDAIQKRLDEMSAFRDRVSDHNARAVTRQEFEGQVGAVRERLEEAIAPLAHQLAEQGKPNWILLIGLLSIVLGVLSGCWLLIGLQINVANTPQVLALEQLKSANLASAQAQVLVEGRLRGLEAASSTGASADAESRSDRGRLNTRVSTLETGVASGRTDSKAAEARFAAALTEIETQFCASDVVRNMTHAHDLRVIAMMWRKINPDAVYPTDNAYYPNICNRSAISRSNDSSP